ncbi:MMPL family transporter [Marinactinospora thermotolerans]|uniref:MMPL family transporter n=1 Tax=Marinactinospora thermotolerans TaxID=531310 RepID=UPI003D8AFBF7
MRRPENRAAALGMWSARHRWTAVLGWTAFVVAAVLVGSWLPQQELTDTDLGTGDSGAAAQILADAGIEEPAGETLIVHDDQLTAADPAFSRAVDDLVDALAAEEAVRDVVAPRDSGAVSADGHSVLVVATLTGDPDTAHERVGPVIRAVDEVAADHPGLEIGQLGAASATKMADDFMAGDFTRAEWTAVPLALGILLVAFGAFAAALLPVALAFTAFLAAVGLLAVFSHLLPVDSGAAQVMLAMGLAVGVDYCLFYLHRERRERAAGRDGRTALRVAAATSGHSVLVSGVTVAVAASGMFLSGLVKLEGYAMSVIIVVLVSMLGSVTVLPALLSLLGERVEWGRVPLRRRARRFGRASTVLARLLDLALSRPGVSALVTTAFLLVLAAPVGHMRTEQLPMDEQVPADSALAVSYRLIEDAFPGQGSAARVVVTADDVTSPPVRAAVTDFVVAAQDGPASGPPQVTEHPAEGVVVIDVPVPGSGSVERAEEAISTLRSTTVPDTLGAAAGVEAAVVGGPTAASMDFNAELREAVPPVFLFVLGTAFLLMLASFRSLPIAVISVALNLLSIGAAYGVMVAVFQYGWGASLIGAEPVGAIESWLPLFVFVVLFALSMDYHVFVVARIHEARLRGCGTVEAVREGISATAGAVTAAAVIMVAVFAIFGSLSVQQFKQMGVGLAAAVVLDATVIRVGLLPAAMALFGERVWYLPRWLAWLPRVSHGAPADAAEGSPADARPRADALSPR